MMGRLNHDQEQFFYSFRLDEAVPEDHAVREIAAVLDLSWAHSELATVGRRADIPQISQNRTDWPGTSGDRFVSSGPTPPARHLVSRGGSTTSVPAAPR